MFDIGGWSHGAIHRRFERPVFVITPEKRDPMPMTGGATYHFVAGGIGAGLGQAKVATGDKDVGIWGAADIIRQALEAGSIDELHLIPISLGGRPMNIQQRHPGRRGAGARR